MSQNFRPRTNSEQVEFDKELKEILAKYAKDRARRTRLGKVANALAKIKELKGKRPSLIAPGQIGMNADITSSAAVDKAKDPQGAVPQKPNMNLDSKTALSRSLHAALNIKSLQANVHLAMIKQQGATIK